MIDKAGDLWSEPADFRVITTNGSIRRNGQAVMGRGCAKEAAEKFPNLPRLLGSELARKGNVVHFFAREYLNSAFGLFTFPVKHQWMETADPRLIARSVADFQRHLLESATYVMPRPGCGNGKLPWAQVRSLLAPLPDNVIVVHFAGEA